MKYEISIDKRAAKFIDKQPPEQKARLYQEIYKLPDGDAKPMKGYRDVYRLRVGTYRVIYTMDNGKYLICVVDAGNRGDVYK